MKNRTVEKKVIMGISFVRFVSFVTFVDRIHWESSSWFTLFFFFSEYIYSYLVQENAEVHSDSLHCPFYTVNKRESQKWDPGLPESQAPALCTMLHQCSDGCIQGYDHSIAFLQTNQ